MFMFPSADSIRRVSVGAFPAPEGLRVEVSRLSAERTGAGGGRASAGAGVASDL